MKKIVLKVDIHDERDKKKAMKAVSDLQGIDSINVDMKDGKITLTGNIDPVRVAQKLKKQFQTDIISVGPDKEPEKKKEDPPKPDPPVVMWQYPYHYVPSQYPSHWVIENDHDSCVIC